MVIAVGCIIAPSIFHAYYVSNCGGWRDRSRKLKAIDIIVNLALLRPLVELVKSCRVSVDLEDPEINNLQDEVRLSMNGRYITLITNGSNITILLIQLHNTNYFVSKYALYIYIYI